MFAFIFNGFKHCLLDNIQKLLSKVKISNDFYSATIAFRFKLCLSNNIQKQWHLDAANFYSF